MIEFRATLQDHLLDKCEDWVGIGTHSTDYVKTFDNHLHDVPIDEDISENLPFVVVNVRRDTQGGESEIGQVHGLRVWEVHIYYIDINSDYNTGEKLRDKLLGKIHKSLEDDPRLGNLSYTEQTTHVKEYVYDLEINDVLFDSSGQEEYYSFVSELYLNVYTAKT